MITEHLHGLSVRNPIQLLEHAHAQQQDGFNRWPPFLGTIAAFQRGPGAGQAWINESP